MGLVGEVKGIQENGFYIIKPCALFGKLIALSPSTFFWTMSLSNGQVEGLRLEPLASSEAG